jgi:Reverse transcriptase (RNA-dependent DNA polymerase)
MKLYEKVLLDRLTQWTTTNNVIDPLQTGFQPGFACIDQANLLYSILQYRKARKLDTYCAFLDIQKAFPSANHDILWHRFMTGEHALSPNDTKLLKLLCTDCFSRVKFQKDHVTDKIHIKVGVKEGACLSPIEFLIFLNDLPRYMRDEVRMGVHMNNIWVGMLMSADDICILASNKEELKNMLLAIEHYLNRLRLRLSPTKCKILVVRHRLRKTWANTTPLAISLVTYTDPITGCSENKYLGFIIQNDLKWTSMTAARLAKTQTLLNRLLLHKHAFRNVSLLAAKRIWTTYGRPILEYGVALWATQKTTRNRLDKLQKKALKTMSGLPKSTNSKLLLAAFNLPSMHERIRAQQFSFLKNS